MNVFSAFKNLLILTFFFLPFSIAAQVLKGKIISDAGEPLAFTSIFVKTTGSGSTSNIEGNYEIKLPVGTHELVFQYLGFGTVVETISISEGQVKNLDIIMSPVTFSLGDVEVVAKDEDPSFTIIRKAIAKAKYHTQQLDQYQARVYLKGSGGLTKIPFLFRKALESDGVDTSFSFTSETVTDVTYQRPGKYTEKVVSVRTTGNDRNLNPVRYINGSFYEPRVAMFISPLSPKAFAYYRFQYLSTYTDRGFNVSRIRVTPRSPGDDMVSGEIHIVEGLWCIHSLNFTVMVQGIEVDVRQIFAPVEENVWMPVSHLYQGRGKLYGFGFEFTYVAAVSDYKITLNQDLNEEVSLVDEKVENEKAKAADRGLKELDGAKEKLKQGEEISNKELRKILKEYEKEERKQSGEADVVREYNFEVDSTASVADSAYWAEVRPIPLTPKEEMGYKVIDSLALEEKKLEEGDTLNKGNRFSPLMLIYGGSFPISKKTTFRIHDLLSGLNYNTVDGWNIDYAVSLYIRNEKNNRLQIRPLARYNFAREKWAGTLMSEWIYGKGARRNNLRLEGGIYYQQFNPEHPISPFVNSLTTLHLRRNWMKIYDVEFAMLQWNQTIVDQLQFNFESRWESRHPLQNNSDFDLFKWIDRDYAPNLPRNEGEYVDFPHHQAIVSQIGLVYRPFEKYVINNKRKQITTGSFPEISAEVTTGVPVAESAVDYIRLESGIKHHFNLARIAQIGIGVTGGYFPVKQSMYFMDYKHFYGNQTPFSPSGYLNQFLQLPYYEYSTNEAYATGMGQISFRRFLFSRIPLLQMSGIREHILVNHLYTENVNYSELGYSISGIFRFLRVDFSASFLETEFHRFMITFGISSSLIRVNRE